MNDEPLPSDALEVIQSGHALGCIIWDSILANPSLGPVKLLKIDLSDGLYRINLNIDDIPGLALLISLGTIESDHEPLLQSHWS